MNARLPEVPDLPPLYEPLALASADNIVDEAVARACAGAPEGTLLWTRSQSSGRGRLGQAWHSPRDGLYAALVLRPEFERDEIGEIVLVGLVSLGTAVADLVVPMTDLRYRWPNDLLLGGSKVASFWLRHDATAEWLVLGFSINVCQRPEQVFDAGSLCEEGGNADIDPELVLSGFGRHFLSWLNRWAEDGVEPVLRQFRSRSNSEKGTPIAMVLPDGEKIAGTSAGVAQDGALVLQADTERRISISRFFGLPSD
ncbi:MAG: biotin--[acetyl-CoA-carboxylase] ligase [Wenzhouxiangellaceae bacterium]|nr:biotin--[acetyl-CoA-carboxylase] ligase [Wenzhouxiangellaceae bacterium]